MNRKAEIQNGIGVFCLFVVKLHEPGKNVMLFEIKIFFTHSEFHAELSPIEMFLLLQLDSVLYR